MNSAATSRPEPRAVPGVHPRVAIAAGYAWRLLVIGAFVVAVVWLAGHLLTVLVPLGVAALLTRALTPVHGRLCRAGLRRGLAAAVTVLAFVVVVAASVGAVGWAVAGEVDDLETTLATGIEDVTDWLVEDGPIDITRAEAEQWRAQAGDALAGFVRSVGGSGGSGVLLVGELIVGAVLALVVTFFFLKDGRRFVGRAERLAPAGRRPQARRMMERAWAALGGYLRGAAVLGVVEAVLIGVTMLLVGASLVPAVMLITFAAAFVPIVGAIAAGVVAVLVALVTAGTVPALVTAGVALVVQQLDNDLLAPWIYGRAIRLHPLVVLLGIAAGGALFGFVGTVFAVPVLAVTLNAAGAAREGTDHDE